MQCGGAGARKRACEVAAINPVASIQAIANPALAQAAERVREKLRSAIEGLLPHRPVITDT